MIKNKTHNAFADIMLGLLCLCVILYFIFITVKSFYPEKEKPITFQVIGINNSANSTTLVSLHYECIRYCIVHVANSYMDNCWNQCAQLGKEVCEWKN